MSSVPPIVTNAPPDEPPPSYEEAVGSSNNSNNPFLQPVRPVPARPAPSSASPSGPFRPRAHSARAESTQPSLPTSPDPAAPPSPSRLSPYPAYQNEHRRAASSPSSPAAARPQPGASSSAQAPKPGPMAPMAPIPRQFPTAFDVYRLPFTDDMVLGEHPSEPIYALEIRAGFRRDVELVLHSGPTMGHPPLATLEEPPPFGQNQNMLVRLPPSPFPGAPAVVALETVVDFPRVGFEFALEVGNGSGGSGGQVPMERFEWRRSRGDAVARLGGIGYGWKLVRLANGPPAGSDRAAWARHIVARGSDGAEVVAAVSESSSFMNLSKVLRFGFFGTGDSGLLGERWAIMAVMTALGLHHRYQQGRDRRRWA